MRDPPFAGCHRLVRPVSSTGRRRPHLPPPLSPCSPRSFSGCLRVRPRRGRSSGSLQPRRSRSRAGGSSGPRTSNSSRSGHERSRRAPSSPRRRDVSGFGSSFAPDGVRRSRFVPSAPSGAGPFCIARATARSGASARSSARGGARATAAKPPRRSSRTSAALPPMHSRSGGTRSPSGRRRAADRSSNREAGRRQ